MVAVVVKVDCIGVPISSLHCGGGVEVHFFPNRFVDPVLMPDGLRESKIDEGMKGGREMKEGREGGRRRKEGREVKGGRKEGRKEDADEGRKLKMKEGR